ncbi:hypothetical protein SAMN05444162_4613 [Paenibacillaceae bacterium GAS479]|nr:hypothetical protein SAMN05444162_4613 [Paenibacillaceae bacterium GAS479]
MTIITILGIVSLAISGILVGAFTSGDRQRANFHSEDADERISKRKWAWWFLLFGIGMMAISAAIHQLF